MIFAKSPNQKQFGIHFGAMSDKIGKQIKKQGFEYDKVTIEKYQACADAIEMLGIHGFLSLKNRDAMRKRLFNKIRAHVKIK